MVSDSVIVADKSGLLLFDGVFRRPELTWKIENIWKRINPAAWSTVQVLIDPVRKSLYCVVPLDSASSPTHVIYGDYTQCTEGMEPTKIKWSLWQFMIPIDFAGVIDVNDVENSNANFNFCNQSIDYIYALDDTKTSDDGTAIYNFFNTALLFLRKSRSASFEGMYHFFNAIKARISGNGVLNLSLKGLDSIKIRSGLRFSLENSFGREVLKPINFANEKMAVKAEMFNLDENFNLSRLDIYCNPAASSRPK